MSLPEMARKKLNLVVGKTRIRPNDVQKWKLMHDFGRYFNGPLSSHRIAAAIVKDMVRTCTVLQYDTKTKLTKKPSIKCGCSQEKQLLHEDLMFDDDDVTDEIRAGAMFKKQVLAQVSSNREKLTAIESKLDSLTKTLERLASRFDEDVN